MDRRKFLTDILQGDKKQNLSDAWANTTAAEDFAPLPTDTYTARIVSGELEASKGGTPGYKLAFRILEGEHAGRCFWHDVWLTPAALPMAKRDLGKLGVTALEQLEKPLPPGIRCSVKLVLRREDDGTEYNRVRTFDVLGVDPVEDDAFAPADTVDGSAANTAPAQADLIAVEPEPDGKAGHYEHE